MEFKSHITITLNIETLKLLEELRGSKSKSAYIEEILLANKPKEEPVAPEKPKHNRELWYYNEYIDTFGIPEGIADGYTEEEIRNYKPVKW